LRPGRACPSSLRFAHDCFYKGNYRVAVHIVFIAAVPKLAFYKLGREQPPCGGPGSRPIPATGIKVGRDSGQSETRNAPAGGPYTPRGFGTTSIVTRRENTAVLHTIKAWLYENLLTSNRNDYSARVSVERALTVKDICRSAVERGLRPPLNRSAA
jgi:hypothetical protein